LAGLRGAIARFYGADGFFLAAGLAFFFLIGMIPLLLLAVSAVGFVLSTEQAAREIVGQLSRNFPVYSREIHRALLRIVETRTLSGLVGTVMLILFATPLFSAARLVMHRMLGIKGGRSFTRNLLVDSGMVLLLAVLLFVVMALTWVMRWLQELVLALVQVPGPWMHRVTLALSLALSAVMFYLGYRYVPYRRPRVGAVLAGAVLASILWEVAKQLFGLYIREVGVYDQIYGPLGVLVAFVMFVYYSAIVFVFGAAYVAALDTRRRAL
jgi:membrane protein